MNLAVLLTTVASAFLASASKIEILRCDDYAASVAEELRNHFFPLNTLSDIHHIPKNIRLQAYEAECIAERIQWYHQNWNHGKATFLYKLTPPERRLIKFNAQLSVIFDWNSDSGAISIVHADLIMEEDNSGPIFL